MESTKSKEIIENSEEDSMSSMSENNNFETGNGSSGDDEKDDKSLDDSQFIKACEVLLNKITQNYREQRDEIRELMKLHKKELRANKKNNKYKKNKDKSGFTKPTPVPDKLAEFLKLEKGCLMSRPQVTALLYDEFKRRNLYYKKDERVIIPDNDVKKLFNLPKDADKSTDAKDKNGLNFYNLQKYIAQCYNDYNKTLTQKSKIDVTKKK